MSLKHHLILFNLLQIIFLSSAQTVENLNYHSEGDKVIITYDLVNCDPEERYYISLTFEEQNTSNKLFPKSISGDISNLSCGNKQISWDVKKDYDSISGKYYPELYLKKNVKNVKDIDGNVYKTVLIGTQLWFAENLKTSKYNDGSPIPNIPDKSQWQNNTTGAWCYYNNDATNNAKYGNLYNWYVVSPIANGNKNVCPTGWHVPTNDEWSILYIFLGNNAGEDDKLKDINNWNKENKKATNSSGFTGLPGGIRDVGYFKEIGYSGYWWSSTDFFSGSTGGHFILRYDNSFNEKDYFGSFYGNGLSIRCVKN